MLVALDLDKKMRMEVNILDYAIREVLFIECENGRWRLVAYYKPVAYLSFHNQHKYCQLAENYKLLVKLFFGVVGLALVV